MDTVSFLYFNDGHEISPVSDDFGDRGGVARIKTLVDNVKNDKIVAFGGDLGGGTLFGGVFKGFPMVEAFNAIPIDLANFGQHDFDAGTANALELIKASRFTWISSNLVGKDGKPFGQVPEYKVFDRQGIRIGVIGLTSAMDTTTQVENVRQLSVIESAKKAVGVIKQVAKPDLIIALTQEPVIDDKALLQAIPDIRVVFTEEEAEEKSFVYDVDGGKRFIFSPQGNMGSVIRLDITKDSNGQVKLAHEIMKADETVKDDAPLAEMAGKYQSRLDKELGKTIAVTETDLSYGDNHESRFQETAIGDLIADAYKDYYKTDIAFANGGGIRASAQKGDFTLKDAKSILPFGNKIVVAEVSGEMLLAALENGVSATEQLAGGFLQVSGISYSYSPDKPVGQRIDKAEVNGLPIDKDTQYKVAMSNYMFTGGDKYTMFGKAKSIVAANEALTDAELLIAYAEKLGKINIKTDNRIQVNGFADVTYGHWAQEGVYGLTGKGIMEGTAEGRFAPSEILSQTEFADLLNKAFSMDCTAAWSQDGLKGLNSESPLTREEMAVIMKWVLEAKGQSVAKTETTDFADNDRISEWAKAAVAGLAKEGLVTGRLQNLFEPKEGFTRAEAAYLLWRLIE
ncbi:5'-nucleotidase C-terminal domain-containing protein [Paenibacillus sepulcri]|uniref:5'-nucleotidase C-terminal domain-containing protein n=1 Tax=Paenibacillus sepulcri TaxID=359917 RepID=A0ABS7BVX9_9BACL|nr:5'-nucleotidase C-terminal domain-containing protein [Paenibacillus sepulcri]